MLLKPVFHLRIFSREANFSFVFIQLVPHGSSSELSIYIYRVHWVPVARPKTNEKFASREKIRKWKTGNTFTHVYTYFNYLQQSI